MAPETLKPYCTGNHEISLLRMAISPLGHNAEKGILEDHRNKDNRKKMKDPIQMAGQIMTKEK